MSRGRPPGASRHAERSLEIEELVDALLVFDEPILNARFHGLLSRTANERDRNRLVGLPGNILEAARLGRRGSLEWARVNGALEKRFTEAAERFLLHAFLTLTEEQLRLIAFMAHSAPTVESRAPFDEMAELHRAVAEALRRTLAARGEPPARPGRLRGAQEEEPAKDLRGQVEAALRQFAAAGHPAREITVSATALRRLRDQGLFAGGDSRILDIPVRVDFGWEAPAFAISTFDWVLVEELRSSASAWGRGAGSGEATG